MIKHEWIILLCDLYNFHSLQTNTKKKKPFFLCLFDKYSKNRSDIVEHGYATWYIRCVESIIVWSEFLQVFCANNESTQNECLFGACGAVWCRAEEDMFTVDQSKWIYLLFV